MSKKIYYTDALKPLFAFVVLMMLFSSNFIFAQKATGNTWAENFVIAYNTPFSYSLDNDTSWELKNHGGKLVRKGKGNINQVFKTPGNYKLHIHEIHKSTDGCEHDDSPAMLNISVMPQKMVFDLSSVKFSEEIRGDQPANGITLMIDVDYSSYDSNPAVYTQGFSTVGVGSSISGNLKNGEARLQPGINTLEFLLEGQAAKGNYIQINFVDTNGLTQPYGLTKKIQ